MPLIAAQRECFGNEDGCDLWYYGEDPNEEKLEETTEEIAASEDRYAKNLEAGRKAVEERAARQAQIEAYNKNRKETQ